MQCQGYHDTWRRWKRKEERQREREGEINNHEDELPVMCTRPTVSQMNESGQDFVDGWFDGFVQACDSQTKSWTVGSFDYGVKELWLMLQEYGQFALRELEVKDLKTVPCYTGYGSRQTAQRLAVWGEASCWQVP